MWVGFFCGRRIRRVRIAQFLGIHERGKAHVHDSLHQWRADRGAAHGVF